MNPSLMWDYSDKWWYIRSWIFEIWDKVTHSRTSLSWQTKEVTNATAMAEDGEVPDGHPP